MGLLAALLAFAEDVVEVARANPCGESLHQFREAVEVGVLLTQHIEIACWCP